MPHVRHLDLTDCTYFPTLLASLPELCPQLESLRLGGFKLTLRRRHRLRTEQEAVKALLQSLPRISHARVQDCWEDEEQPEVRALSCVLLPCVLVISADYITVVCLMPLLPTGPCNRGSSVPSRHVVRLS